MKRFTIPKSHLNQIESQAKSLCKELSKEANDKLKKYYRQAITDFYMSYEPIRYVRHWELYNTGEFNITNSADVSYAELTPSEKGMTQDLYYGKTKDGQKIMVSIEDIYNAAYFGGLHGFHIQGSAVPNLIMGTYFDEMMEYYTSICTGD